MRWKEASTCGPTRCPRLRAIDPDLTVTVKRVPGGVVSNWFNDDVHEGSVLEVTRPAGVFCPSPGEPPGPALCGGSGVTPVMSIAKQPPRAHGQEREAALREPGPRFGDLRFSAAGICRLSNPDRLVVVHHYDSLRGYLGAEAIEGFASQSLDADFYLCGPQAFMDLASETLERIGIGPDRILVERFEPAGAAPMQRDAVADGTEGALDAEHEAPQTVTLVLKGKSTTVAYRAGDTVLETARRAGLQPPFSCEAGNCATCMALLTEGTATMRANNALTEDEVVQGWLLTCQALPRGRSVKVEYESF